MIVWSVAFENLADFKQSEITNAAIGIALGGREQTRQKARAHVGEIGRNRIGERQFFCATTEKLCTIFRDEGPSDGFDKTLRSECTARDARTLL